jgi:hypothetical protein
VRKVVKLFGKATAAYDTKSMVPYVFRDLLPIS